MRKTRFVKFNTTSYLRCADESTEPLPHVPLWTSTFSSWRADLLIWETRGKTSRIFLLTVTKKKIDIIWRQGDTTIIAPYCMLFLTIFSIHNNPHVLSENMLFHVWIPFHRLWTHKCFLWLWKRKMKMNVETYDMDGHLDVE